MAHPVASLSVPIWKQWEVYFPPFFVHQTSKLSVLQPLQGCPGCGGRRRAELGSWAGGASGNLGGRRGLYFAVLESNTGPKTVNRKLFSLPYLPAFLGNNLGCLGFFNLFLFKKKNTHHTNKKNPVM